MLYLPPRLPHQGVSTSDECITVSMGFRTPSYRSMITAFTERITSSLDEKLVFNSDEAVIQPWIGEITESTRKKAKHAIRQHVCLLWSVFESFVCVDDACFVCLLDFESFR